MTASRILLFLNILAEAYHLSQDKTFKEDLLHLTAGMAAWSKDKLQDYFKQYQGQDEMLQEHGEQLLNNILESTSEVRNDVDSLVDKLVTKALNKINVATQNDIATLEKRLNKLEDQV